MLRLPVIASGGRARSLASAAAASGSSTPTDLAKATPIFSASGSFGAAPICPRPPPDSTMARWNRPLASGVATRVWTENPPALSPKIVTRLGSPPKAAMFRCTHFSPSSWSMKP